MLLKLTFFPIFIFGAFALKKRSHYELSFKQMAVELCLSGKGTGEVAEELGINSGLLSRWKREYKRGILGSSTSGSKKVLSAEQAEIARLKKELREAKLERDILKKAVNIFSRSDGRSTGL